MKARSALLADVAATPALCLPRAPHFYSTGFRQLYPANLPAASAAAKEAARNVTNCGFEIASPKVLLMQVRRGDSPAAGDQVKIEELPAENGSKLAGPRVSPPGSFSQDPRPRRADQVIAL